MIASVYVTRIIPVSPSGESPRVFVTAREAKAHYKFLSEYAKKGLIEGYWSEVQLVKETFMGSPRTCAAAAIVAGSVISRGRYVSKSRMCDAEWGTELIAKTECKEITNAS